MLQLNEVDFFHTWSKEQHWIDCVAGVLLLLEYKEVVLLWQHLTHINYMPIYIQSIDTGVN